MNTALAPDIRAELLLRVMTLEEKIQLLHGHAPAMMRERPPDVTPMAGYIAAIPRLGIPALRATDAGLGVVSPAIPDHGVGSIVLPSGLGQAATWNPQMAFDAGAILGGEARGRGYNILLAGAMNLTREPRNGRNFEYAGEDPLLAGTMAGEEVRGIQSRGIVSTVKHFAFNDQETGRGILDARIDAAALRESDLLAFEIAIERGSPGAVMCAYNRLNGAFACENPALLNDALKRDWKYPGWVMSDWGATHSTDAALYGLDQEMGTEYDGVGYFDRPLRHAVDLGTIPQARVNDMVRRILRSLFASGVMDEQPPLSVNYEADALVSQRVAEEAIVLLKNDSGLLPLAAGSTGTIAIIGGHADIGVLAGGGGSSAVSPYGGSALSLRGPLGDWPVNQIYLRSSPLEAIRRRLPNASVQYDSGTSIESAVALARNSTVAIVFATQWTTESADMPNLSLPDEQDQLIAAVAAANPHTIVVLETGGPVRMPWLSQTAAVVEAWYPGSRGGEAVARLLFGEANPSGRLPLTFPQDESQLPRPEIPGLKDLLALRTRQPPGRLGLFSVDYFEGADVGYRWYESHQLTPLFPFGYGLSYSTFRYENLIVDDGPQLTVRFEVSNTGTRAGSDVAQVYAAGQLPDGRTIHHLVGWSKVFLQPGQTENVTVHVDLRTLASFDLRQVNWRVASGEYKIVVGRFSGDVQLRGQAMLAEQRLPP